MLSSVDDQARGAKVMVTGATGYVAGPLIRRLVQAGADVHAAVRDPSDVTRLRHLMDLADEAPGSLRFFRGNLLEPQSYDAAIADCSIVFHTASPFLDMAKVSDPQKDLVEPALNGTVNVLDSVNRCSDVVRVVLTSSAAAMAGGPADLEKTGGSVGERSWNTSSSLENGPYMYSKTIAEQAAWRIADAQNRWSLVAINPGTVLGPGLAEVATSASFDRVRSLADGSFRNGLPPVRFGMVDVRDVAEAHFQAAFRQAAHGRYLIAERVYSFGELVEILREKFGDGYMFPQDTRLPAGLPRYEWDTSKSTSELGLVYRPVAPAVISMFEQLVDTGQLAPAY